MTKKTKNDKKRIDFSNSLWYYNQVPSSRQNIRKICIGKRATKTYKKSKKELTIKQQSGMINKH